MIWFQYRKELIDKIGLSKVTAIVAGGKERQDSVKKRSGDHNGNGDVVIYSWRGAGHLYRKKIRRVVAAAKTTGAAVAGVKVERHYKRTKKDNMVATTIPRQEFMADANTSGL